MREIHPTPPQWLLPYIERAKAFSSLPLNAREAAFENLRDELRSAHAFSPVHSRMLWRACGMDAWSDS